MCRMLKMKKPTLFSIVKDISYPTYYLKVESGFSSVLHRNISNIGLELLNILVDTVYR